ncbi:DUF1624 domain-containing protein [Candidatus Woesearchaeota archaeon]|nr:DUF1624 domain-containing protein [Candidatus Woesearchaeota archaeon]
MDIVKSVGVLLMIVLHVIIWWYIPLDYGGSKIQDRFYFFVPFLKFIGLFVIILPITAGASLRFYLGKKTKLGKGGLVKIAGRSIFLILLGYLMNFLAFGHEEFFDWDVLQFIGVGFLILAFMYNYFHTSLMWAIGVVVLFSAPHLRVLLDSLKLNYFVAVLISNNEGTFFWPFFPWFSFLVYGFLIADIYIKHKNKKKIYSTLVIVSIFILIVALYKNELFFRDIVTNIWGPGIFQATTLTLLGDISIFNLLLVFSDIFLKKLKRSKFGFLNTFSRGILWIYVLHIIIGYHLVDIMQRYVSDKVYVMIITMLILFFIAYLIGVLVVWLRGKNNMITTD